MAKKALVNKANKKPKFKVRGYTRCNRCGRPHAVYRKFGLCRIRVGIMMFNLSPLVVWGRPERDAGIAAMCRSIRAAGAAGFPVVEYNFYNHRAVEGYGQRPGRGGAATRTSRTPASAPSIRTRRCPIRPS